MLNRQSVLSLMGTSSSMRRNEQQNREDTLLQSIVDKLGTLFNVPDQEVIKQDDYTEKEVDIIMYFISKGQCIVTVRDQNGTVKEENKLEEGEHFGEIGIIYQSRRTATVVSRNYNTFARIIRPRYRELISEYPEYEICLKDHIQKTYNDSKIQFLKRMVKQVDYLAACDDTLLNEIIFSLIQTQYEKNSIVLHAKEPADQIYFVEEGVVEVYTQFEGNEFIIDRLPRGSVINHRAFFIQDVLYVNLRCFVDSKLISLTQDSMRTLIHKYEGLKMGRDLLIYQNKILK